MTILLRAAGAAVGTVGGTGTGTTTHSFLSTSNSNFHKACSVSSSSSSSSYSAAALCTLTIDADVWTRDVVLQLIVAKLATRFCPRQVQLHILEKSRTAVAKTTTTTTKEVAEETTTKPSSSSSQPPHSPPQTHLYHHRIQLQLGPTAAAGTSTTTTSCTSPPPTTRLTERNAIVRALAGPALNHALDRPPFLFALGGHSLHYANATTVPNLQSSFELSACMARAAVVEWMDVARTLYTAAAAAATATATATAHEPTHEGNHRNRMMTTTALDRLEHHLREHAFVVPQAPRPTVADWDLAVAFLFIVGSRPAASSSSSPPHEDDEDVSSATTTTTRILRYPPPFPPHVYRWLCQCWADLKDHGIEDIIRLSSATDIALRCLLPNAVVAALFKEDEQEEEVLRKRRPVVPVFFRGTEEEESQGRLIMMTTTTPTTTTIHKTATVVATTAAATAAAATAAATVMATEKTLPATTTTTAIAIANTTMAADSSTTTRSTQSRKQKTEKGNPTNHHKNNKAEKSQTSTLVVEKSKSGDIRSSTEYTIGALDIRVGKIIHVWEHESADKLFCEVIDVGDDDEGGGGPRRIASGLRPYYRREDLLDQFVVVVCNLKARNLVGFASHGMVLCATSSTSNSSSSTDPDTRVVELIVPTPPGHTTLTVGERIVFEGYEDIAPEPENKVAKKKIFEALAVDLHTDGEGRVMWKQARAKTATTGATITSMHGLPHAKVS